MISSSGSSSGAEETKMKRNDENSVPEPKLSKKESPSIKIQKRAGILQEFDHSKLLNSFIKQSEDLSINLESLEYVAEKVLQGLTHEISTEDLIQLSTDICASNNTLDPDFSMLAGRIFVSNLHKQSPSNFLEFAELIHSENTLIFSEDMMTFIRDHSQLMQQAIDYSRDYTYNYFGIRTMAISYLLKVADRIVERPQHLLMRVSLALNFPDIESTISTYKILSQKLYTHATPTLCNSGRKDCQMASCFLLTVDDDSIEGIYKTLSDSAILSKYCGGIGISISHIRACGAKLKRTGNTSQGIIPMVKVFASTALYVNQGGNSRPGAIALYLEPWHADILDFLDLRKNQGSDERRARNIFTALWIPDLFMRRVESDSDWTLMSEDSCPGLVDSYGKEFETLYEKYERENRGFRTIKARQVWNSIVESQIETGTPYMCYKDAVNIKNNQKNLGTIRNSNLCAEIVEYSSRDDIAVCNLASLVLPQFVDVKEQRFDFDKLYEVSKTAIFNLDKVVDKNYYPLDIAKSSNMKNRPVGLGVQGLADVFMSLHLSFDCEQARVLNRQIFETIYFASLTASCELAKLHGTYSSYEGSPMSQGLLSFDLWNDSPTFNKWNWNELREKISKFGVRNSLLTTCMPTASTSNIMGFTECIEPITSNIYIRRVLSGEFQVCNSYLVKELKALGIWNKAMKNRIVKDNGSVQSIKEIPEDVKEVYRTVWEIPQKSLIDMAADRAPFIDQTQSMNVFLANPTHQQVTSMHFHGWKKGLKTGMYYLRTKPAANAFQFSIDSSDSTNKFESKNSSSKSLNRNMSADQISKAILCRLEDPESCAMCGS